MEFPAQSYYSSEKTEIEECKPGQLIGPGKRNPEKCSGQNLGKDTDNHNHANYPYHAHKNFVIQNMNNFPHPVSPCSIL
jgi:hypothetical protein